MLEKMTDLAIESHEIHAERGEDDGIAVETRESNGLKVTVATVFKGEGEKKAGRPAGKYITIETGRVWHAGRDRFAAAANAAAAEIKALLPESGCVLAAGLGNESITSDSIGPKAVKSLIVTRHLKSMAPRLYSEAGFGELAAVAPGVLGQTGVESADLICGVCEKVSPACVIIIDSLAARRLDRLATTLQISDSGISPGSGVFNRRTELNPATLGVPVISVGVPTVVDARTLAADILESCGAGTAAAEAAPAGLFVTPKDADVIAKETARLVAYAINRAVHGLEINEMGDYLGQE